MEATYEVHAVMEWIVRDIEASEVSKVENSTQSEPCLVKSRPNDGKIQFNDGDIDHKLQFYQGKYSISENSINLLEDKIDELEGIEAENSLKEEIDEMEAAALDSENTPRPNSAPPLLMLNTLACIHVLRPTKSTIKLRCGKIWCYRMTPEFDLMWGPTEEPMTYSDLVMGDIQYDTDEEDAYDLADIFQDRQRRGEDLRFQMRSIHIPSTIREERSKEVEYAVQDPPQNGEDAFTFAKVTSSDILEYILTGDDEYDGESCNDKLTITWSGTTVKGDSSSSFQTITPLPSDSSRSNSPSSSLRSISPLPTDDPNDVAGAGDNACERKKSSATNLRTDASGNGGDAISHKALSLKRLFGSRSRVTPQCCIKEKTRSDAPMTTTPTCFSCFVALWKRVLSFFYW